MSGRFIRIILPLTSHSSKIRVKKRKDIFYQGIPLATRQEKITNDCYFEWQISYDLKETNPNFAKLHEKTLNKIKIVDENKNPTDRYIHELSDLLTEIVRKGFINLSQIEKLLKEVQEEKKFVEEELEVCRTQPKEYKLGKWNFLLSTIKHPLLIYEISELILKIEIIIKEKQKALGIQPMLFLCIPIKLVEEFSEIEGKLAETKQKATYLITESNFQLIIETVKIFALLSRKHHRDVVNILRTVLWFWEENKENESKIPQIRNAVIKIDTRKIIDYQKEYPKSNTLKEVIRYSRIALNVDDEKVVFKMGVKLAYNLDRICDANGTANYVKDEQEKKYWLEISEELFKHTIGKKK